MIKYLSVGWGVPLFPSMLGRIGKNHGVSVRQLNFDLNPLTTYEISGPAGSIDAFMAEVGAEEEDESIHGG